MNSSRHQISSRPLPPAPRNLPAEIANVVEYRKSGLSLNHVVGCPLDCGYCVRHLFNNFEMKRPHLVMDDKQAVAALTQHWAFRKDVTPIQLFNRATDPFLPGVKEHLHHTLELLDNLKLKNHVLVISRWKINRTDVERLERLRHLRLTVLITWSGIDDLRIEPVDSNIAATSLAMLAASATRTKSVLYWRPLVAGLNDSVVHIARARELANLANATVFTGLFYREQIRQYFNSVGVQPIYRATHRRKIMPREVEQRVLQQFRGAPLFRKTSCAVAFAHALPDYNGHFGIERICDICPTGQVDICRSNYRMPDMAKVEALVRFAGISAEGIEIADGRILVEGSTEQQRYFVQHSLGYQVHDRAHPHLSGRHGRAEEGWE